MGQWELRFSVKSRIPTSISINSHHSRQHKESVIRSLVKRGNTFPSDEQERLREAKHIDGALRANK